MRIIILFFCLFFPHLSWSNNISVGGVSFEIPSPKGFGPVKPSMGEVYELVSISLAPTNTMFLTLLSNDDLAISSMGEFPEMRKGFSVQTLKLIENKVVTASDFAILKNSLKKMFESQSSELMNFLQGSLNDHLGDANDFIKNKHNIYLALSVSKFMPLPVHEETDMSMSYSTLIRFDARDEMGNPDSFVMANSVKIIHMKGRVLFLYSFSDYLSLDWTRSALQEWAESVIDHNRPNHHKYFR